MENGWYHVMNRGIDARQLFPDNKANEHFRELLARMPTRFGLRIHAYWVSFTLLPPLERGSDKATGWQVDRWLRANGTFRTFNNWRDAVNYGDALAQPSETAMERHQYKLERSYRLMRQWHLLNFRRDADAFTDSFQLSSHFPSAAISSN